MAILGGALLRSQAVALGDVEAERVLLDGFEVEGQGGGVELPRDAIRGRPNAEEPIGGVEKLEGGGLAGKVRVSHGNDVSERCVRRAALPDLAGLGRRHHGALVDVLHLLRCCRSACRAAPRRPSW